MFFFLLMHYILKDRKKHSTKMLQEHEEDPESTVIVSGTLETYFVNTETVKNTLT